MQQHHAMGIGAQQGAQMDKEPTSLDISITEMDNQLSRFFNGLNRLDQLSDKLKREPTPLKPEPKGEVPMTPTDHCGKLEHQNGVFNQLNNHLESLLATLSRII